MRENTPDLIVTDYKMPQMDGAEFIGDSASCREPADIPVIVITIYEERSFRLRALEAGATDFLQNPVDHHEFVTGARNLLKLRGSSSCSITLKAHSSERSREEAHRHLELNAWRK